MWDKSISRAGYSHCVSCLSPTKKLAVQQQQQQLKSRVGPEIQRLLKRQHLNTRQYNVCYQEQLDISQKQTQNINREFKQQHSTVVDKLTIACHVACTLSGKEDVRELQYDIYWLLFIYDKNVLYLVYASDIENVRQLQYDIYLVMFSDI